MEGARHARVDDDGGEVSAVADGRAAAAPLRVARGRGVADDLDEVLREVVLVRGLEDAKVGPERAADAGAAAVGPRGEERVAEGARGPARAGLDLLVARVHADDDGAEELCRVASG